MITIYSIMVKFDSTSGRWFTSEESYQDAWDKIYKFRAINYPKENIHHIHSCEETHKK